MSKHSETAIVGQIMKEEAKASKAENLAHAMYFWSTSSIWARHTQYHWSTYIGGDKLDYWPSTDKYQYKGKVRRASPEKLKAFIERKMLEKERKNGSRS